MFLRDIVLKIWDTWKVYWPNWQLERMPIKKIYLEESKVSRYVEDVIYKEDDILLVLGILLSLQY